MKTKNIKLAAMFLFAILLSLSNIARAENITITLEQYQNLSEDLKIVYTRNIRQVYFEFEKSVNSNYHVASTNHYDEKQHSTRIKNNIFTTLISLANAYDRTCMVGGMPADLVSDKCSTAGVACGGKKDSYLCGPLFGGACVDRYPADTLSDRCYDDSKNKTPLSIKDFSDMQPSIENFYKDTCDPIKFPVNKQACEIYKKRMNDYKAIAYQSTGGQVLCNSCQNVEVPLSSDGFDNGAYNQTYLQQNDKKTSSPCEIKKDKKGNLITKNYNYRQFKMVGKYKSHSDLKNGQYAISSDGNYAFNIDKSSYQLTINSDKSCVLKRSPQNLFLQKVVKKDAALDNWKNGNSSSLNKDCRYPDSHNNFENAQALKVRNKQGLEKYMLVKSFYTGNKQGDIENKTKTWVEYYSLDENRNVVIDKKMWNENKNSKQIGEWSVQEVVDGSKLPDKWSNLVDRCRVLDMKKKQTPPSSNNNPTSSGNSNSGSK